MNHRGTADKTSKTGRPNQTAATKSTAPKRDTKAAVAPQSEAQSKPGSAGEANGEAAGARWRGQAVDASEPPGQTAEEAAARAEGNEAVRADARGPQRGTPGHTASARPSREDEQDAAENAEEKRQSAADAHADRRRQDPIRGHL